MGGRFGRFQVPWAIPPRPRGLGGGRVPLILLVVALMVLPAVATGAGAHSGVPGSFGADRRSGSGSGADPGPAIQGITTTGPSWAGSDPISPAVGPHPETALYYQWVGAATNPSTPGAVDGIGSTVVVAKPPVPCPSSGTANFDRSSLEITVTGTVVANLGFFLDNNSLGKRSCATSGPYPYYRDASGNFEVVCGGGPLSLGAHRFNATDLSGTNTWRFEVDGSPMAGTTFNWSSGRCDGPTVSGDVDLGSATASLSSLWSALKEETTSAIQSFWNVPAFRFPTAFAVDSAGTWTDVPVGMTTRVSSAGTPTPPFGVEGTVQNASLLPDEIRVGDGIPWPSTLSVLWAPPITIRLTVVPSNGSAPLAVRCSAEVVGGTGTYSSFWWEFGDGATSSTEAATHLYEGGGRFNVTLTITDSGGERTTSSVTHVDVAPWSPAPTRPTPLSLPTVELLVGALAVAAVAVGVERAVRSRHHRP